MANPITKETREQTSIKILPSVWKIAKKAAIDENIDLSVYVEKSLIYWNSLSLEQRRRLAQ